MSERQFIGVINQGTTGTQFVVFDRVEPVAEAFSAVDRMVDGYDRVEYDPEDLWTSTLDSIQRGLRRADIGPEELAGIGFATQRQTTVVWDRKTGQPVGNAIGWQDRHTAGGIATLDRGEIELIRNRTGLIPDPYFAGPKLKGLLDTDDALRARAHAGGLLFGTVDSWLVYNLTGRHVTDVTNAAQTMLFDIREQKWDDDLLALFDVPRAMLPEVRPSSDPVGFGRTDPDGVLATEIPVTGVLGDQQASLVGQAGFDPGDAKVTYGSGNFFLQNTGDEPVQAGDDLLTTIWFQEAGEDPLYGLEGPVFTTGSILERLGDVGFLDEPERITRLSRSVDSTDGVFVVPEFDGFGSQRWGPGSRISLVGLARHTRREHVARAAVESIAFGTRAAVEAAETATGVEHDRLRVDGGAIYDDEFARMQATLIGIPLVRSAVTQTAALGAAVAAGLALEVWESPTQVREQRTIEETFRPEGSETDAVDRRYRDWRDVVDTVRCL
ncbi:glycerol kinase [Halalkaliarchaeum desulfuricum]|uniref:Glycerol kinase n=1 Tax=Halalkaliarchaeum desulfuricum TaxID=2055893 RepID=A0A343TGP6_9EURY|nr:FGGY family carbohydrate kinase [Halalkaliarchaeum desulfuricum]AUX08268.1 glycerol kinase [Halalkaliarchaeum desulfuricum]